MTSVALAQNRPQQNRPQMTWQGSVRGSAVLYIQGERVDVQGRETGSVDRPTFKMFQPLPAAKQTVRIEVRRGRGRAEVIEQPVPDNEYTAVVRIDPAGTQHERFVIDCFWDPERRSFDSRRDRIPATSRFASDR